MPIMLDTREEHFKLKGPTYKFLLQSGLIPTFDTFNGMHKIY